MKVCLAILAALLLCVMLSGAAAVQPKITFKGGAGDTTATAVVISGATNSLNGVAAEYNWFTKKFGQKNEGWKLRRQSVLQHKGKVHDVMEIELLDGTSKTFFFDISEFFGKL